MQFGIFTVGDVTPDPTTGRTPSEYERLEALTEELAGKVEALLAEAGIQGHVNRVGSLFNVHASPAPITDYASALAGDRALVHELFLAALNHGVVFTGRGMGCLSTPMTSVEVDAFVDALREGLADLGLMR